MSKPFTTWLSEDLFTFTVRSHKEECSWGRRYLGPSRWALDLGHISLIFEFWWRRK